MLIQIVIDRLIERDQDPCISDKIKEFIKEAGFEIICSTKRHTFPGKPPFVLSTTNLLGRLDHLNREFLWDIKNIFKNCRPFVQDHLGLTSDQYPDFLEQIVQESRKAPEPQWDVVSILGRKIQA